jgi:hypothetical protein
MNRRSSWTHRATAVVAVLVSIALLPAEGFGRDLRPVDAQAPANATPYTAGTYKAKGTATDAADARIAVAAMGRGRTIDLTERGSVAIRAEIYDIAPDYFTVKIGPAMRDVAYRDVVRLKRAGMSKQAKTTIAAAAIMGAAVVIYFLGSADGSERCVPIPRFC